MSHAEDMQKHVKTYFKVFGALLVLTFITVAISRIDMGTTMNVIVALLVALLKGSLVVCFFMHLISEKQLIYIALSLTVIFFVVLLFGPVLGRVGDMPAQDQNPVWSVLPEKQHVEHSEHGGGE